MMAQQLHYGMIQLSPLSSYAVLEIVEISHASFVHFLMQYAPHTVANEGRQRQNWRPQQRLNDSEFFFFLAKTGFFNDVTVMSSFSASIDGTFYNFSVAGNVRMMRVKNFKNLPKFVKVTAKILSVPFLRTRYTSSPSC